ncbi:MAG TPA: GNAT family N-acetyltransferase [Candidatus Krumholzibacteriaceae bacterium]|nr:GNAT family N-acetyltransferase [Candidatus Krumholzibacteriaceae bacterium]
MTFFTDFTSERGLKVVLRPPTWGDIDDLFELHNELIEEEAMIGGDSKRTRDQQVDSHAEMMKAVESGRAVVVIAEADGKAVGQSNARKRRGRLKHTAGLGVFVRKQYRDQGIGSEMMRELENQAGALGIEILYLEVYGISPAMRLYERLGYLEHGRLPGGIKYRGEYVDCISMYKRISG